MGPEERAAVMADTKNRKKFAKDKGSANARSELAKKARKQNSIAGERSTSGFRLFIIWTTEM